MAGTGTFVTVAEGNVDPFAPGTLVAQRFEDTLEYADQWKTLSATAYSTLTGYITQLEEPEGWQDAFDEVTLPSITAIDFNTRPSFSSLVLPDDWPDSFPDLPALNAAPVTDFSFTAPTKPDAVNPTIDYTPTTYSSTMYTALYNSIYAYIQDPTLGIPSTVWDAMKARAMYAHSQATAEKYAADMRAAGATGFNFADGQIAGIQQDASKSILDKDDDVENSILIQASDLAQKMQMFAIDKGVALEQILRDFYDKWENRSLDSKKTIANFVLQVYSEGIKAYIAEWEGIKTELEAKTSVVELVYKENALIIEGFKANASAYVSKVEAVSKQIEGIVRGFEGEVAGYEAETKALTAYYNSLTEQEKSYIALADIKLRKATAELEYLLKSKLSYDQLKATIAEGQAKVAQQAVSGALNAVNASASLGYTGSESTAEHWSHNDSINESHAFEEDTPV